MATKKKTPEPGQTLYTAERIADELGINRATAFSYLVEAGIQPIGTITQPKSGRPVRIFSKEAVDLIREYRKKKQEELLAQRSERMKSAHALKDASHLVTVNGEHAANVSIKPDAALIAQVRQAMALMEKVPPELVEASPEKQQKAFDLIRKLMSAPEGAMDAISALADDAVKAG